MNLRKLITKIEKEKEHLLDSSYNRHHQTSKMTLLPLELANLAYFHGHVCPELVVGYRAVLLAMKRASIGLSILTDIKTTSTTRFGKITGM